MHERERRGEGLQRMAPVVAREAGASSVTAREAVVAREAGALWVALVAPRAASVGSMRPRGSEGGFGGVDEAARLRWRRRRAALVAPGASTLAGDGDEVGRWRIGEMVVKWGEGWEEVVAGGKPFLG